jgi:hypothetical protein
MQSVPLFLQKPGQKGKVALGYRPFKLMPRQSVNLDKHESGLGSTALGLRQLQEPDQPLAATEPAVQLLEKCLTLASHGRWMMDEQ